MNILVAPNSMKGSLDAFTFAQTVSLAIRKVSPVFHVRTKPLADGGDYTGAVLMDALSARKIHVEVNDPLNRIVVAEMGIAGNVAIVEMASASGLRLLKQTEFNPEAATSKGTGEMILHALKHGCKKILLGIGGSATIDGGIGMLAALGFEFTDRSGNLLEPVPGSLANVSGVRFPVKTHPEFEIVILCDVSNPLLGPMGAASVYGPQKGASIQMIEKLEAGLGNWVDVLERLSGKMLRDESGMGAAGGVATGLVALLNARIEVGANFIFDILDIDSCIDWADWIITGEGKVDSQSLSRKAPYALCERARIQNKPVTAITGSFEPEASAYFDGIFSIATGPMATDESMDRSHELVRITAGQLARLMLRADTGVFKSHTCYFEALTHIQDNHFEKAINKINEIGDTLAAFWNCKGLLSRKQQKWGEALNYFQRALEIDPEFDAAKVNIEMIRRILNFTNPFLKDP
jgi:glycerate 2-kinase